MMTLFAIAASTSMTLSGATAYNYCAADLNMDGSLDYFDTSIFQAEFTAQTPTGDWNGDGIWDLADINAYLADFDNCCPPDLNGDGVLDYFDISIFQAEFTAQTPLADWNGDGIWDLADINAYLADYDAGC